MTRCPSDAFGSSIRTSQPVSGQGGTFVPMVVITEQMVRFPNGAPLSALDAFQSSWPAPGSCSSLGAVRCSVSLRVTVSPALEQSSYHTPSGVFHRQHLLSLILLIIYIIKNAVCTPPRIIQDLRILHGSDRVVCSSRAYGGYSAS